MVTSSSEMLRSSSEALEATFSASTQIESGEKTKGVPPREANSFDDDDVFVVENAIDRDANLDLDPDEPENDSFADAYFAELLSHSLDRLSQEPQVLEAERKRTLARGLEAALTETGKSAPAAAAAALSSAAKALRDAASAASAAAAALPRAADAADAFARLAPSLRRRMEQDGRARKGCAAAAELRAACRAAPGWRR